MWLDERDRNDRGERGHLKCDEGFDRIRRQAGLDATEVLPVVVAGMRAYLDAKLDAAQCGGYRRRHRACVDAAGNARAVDVRQDRVVRARALTQVGVEVHLCCVSPWRSSTACPTTGITAASDSAAPLMLPGTLMIRV